MGFYNLAFSLKSDRRSHRCTESEQTVNTAKPLHGREIGFRRALQRRMVTGLWGELGPTDTLSLTISTPVNQESETFLTLYPGKLHRPTGLE